MVGHEFCKRICVPVYTILGGSTSLGMAPNIRPGWMSWEHHIPSIVLEFRQNYYSQ